jgi:hypothetical protein
MESIILFASLTALIYYVLYRKLKLSINSPGDKAGTISGITPFLFLFNCSQRIELWIYPIKSCKGISGASFAIGDRGFLYDRNWMLVEADTNKFLTQREYPRVRE